MSYQQIVNETWMKYDKDNNGYLRQMEATKFYDEICKKEPSLNEKRN